MRTEALILSKNSRAKNFDWKLPVQDFKATKRLKDEIVFPVERRPKTWEKYFSARKNSLLNLKICVSVRSTQFLNPSYAAVCFTVLLKICGTWMLLFNALVAFLERIWKFPWSLNDRKFPKTRLNVCNGTKNFPKFESFQPHELFKARNLQNYWNFLNLDSLKTQKCSKTLLESSWWGFPSSNNWKALLGRVLSLKKCYKNQILKIPLRFFCLKIYCKSSFCKTFRSQVFEKGARAVFKNLSGVSFQKTVQIFFLLNSC